MGQGIAQIAAQAGSLVRLFDVHADATGKAGDALAAQWDKLMDKGRLDRLLATDRQARLRPVATLEDLADFDLVIEAIVEHLDVKKSLFFSLESVVSPQTVLASNTSSLSITAIGAGLKHPGRVAGYHFFNPVPLLKVVEVIAGLKTDATTCIGLTEYARANGSHADAGPGHTGLYRQSRRPRRCGAIGLSLMHEEH